MSDCSRRAWRVPEKREPDVLYMHGHPGVDYSKARALEVDGVRFERAVRCREDGEEAGE